MNFKTLGIDQYGNYYRLGKYPRKELLERLGRKHCQKMYCDTNSGESKHIGYVIAGLWITLLEVYPFSSTKNKK